MNKLLFGAAVAAILAGPAAAVQVTGASAGADNSVSVFATAPGLLQADYLIGRGGPITLDLVVEAGDEGGISFDSIIDVDTGIVLGQNLKGLSLTLLGGPTFSAIGDVAAAFSTPVVTGAAGDAVVRIKFLPVGEGAQAALGNPFGLDTDPGDFWIDIANLSAGDSFQLVVSGAVPEASTWVMLIAGFGLVGGAVRRRRGAVAA
jgi:hypothetical protein